MAARLGGGFDCCPMKKSRAKSRCQAPQASPRDPSTRSEHPPEIATAAGGIDSGVEPTRNEALRQMGALYYGVPVRLTKVENHRADGRRGNFKIGFWVVGYLVRELAVGSRVHLDSIVCTKNQDDWDWFVSSEIKAIRGNRIETKNSVWRITRARLKRKPLTMPPALGKLVESRTSRRSHLRKRIPVRGRLPPGR